MPAIKKVLFLFLLSLGAAFAHAGSGNQPAEPSSATATPSLSLMFFINPAGGPCQVQEEILNRFRTQIEKRAKIVPVSTMSFSAPLLFRKFGIRHLPALVLVDANQQEIMRFAPGVQSGEQILKQLSEVKVARTK
ncbi:MAG: hypothetical protein BWY57_00369 [Betaproteobacteria bacterium ADurb.Bin341]|nr:MAG: hypothetical protein BWY57_00369 [Betaproteobacteria bacterium ADurb.Bin341]